MQQVQQLGLRDIHLPQAVSWWPPAFGWWMLLGVMLMLATGLLLIRLWRRYRRLRTSAILEFKQICDAFGQHHDNLRLIRELSVLLRRIVVSYFPRHDVASLTGNDWLQFLDTCFDKDGGLSGSNQGFLNGPGKILNNGPYQARLEVDTQALILLCRRWVEDLPIKPVTPGRVQ